VTLDHHPNIDRTAITGSGDTQALGQIIGGQSTPTGEIICRALRENTQCDGWFFLALSNQRIGDGIDRAIATTGYNAFCSALQCLVYHPRFLGLVVGHQHTKLDTLFTNCLDRLFDLGLIGRFPV
jgi:hypothetical protein